MDHSEYTKLIKRHATQLGFSLCGVSRAEFLESEAARFEQWLKRGFQGEMFYLEDHLEVRVDPRRLMPGAKSIVSLTHGYFHPTGRTAAPPYRISMYAYGKDYHRVLKKKLTRLIELIRADVGPVEALSCVDSAPVMEKAWAARAGLGWIGKNSTLVAPRAGSYHFLAELILDVELDYDHPVGNHCGVCRACIDACPTGAIVEPYVLDATRCISYLTVESKAAIPESMAGTYADWVFGCDACQAVCPFNRFAVAHEEPAFAPTAPAIFDMTAEEWRKLSPKRFEELFQGSAVMRARYDGLMRNIRFLGRSSPRA
jgi:epoxyqueuosine reductase